MNTQEHPFAQFVRILGRGPTRSRPMTMDESEQAMTMIMAGDVTPEQLGAFLMLLRVNTETSEEIAGFVKASKASLNMPKNIPAVDLDWSSYAGKKRQLPYFILAALTLVQSGITIMMQGAEGHTEGRMYTGDILQELGIPSALNLQQASEQIEQTGFAYITLENLSPELHHIIGLRPLLGLRSPIHTLGRMLNPFDAPHSVQGIFHPNYMPVHQVAAQLLEQPHMAVFRGEGGEVEVRPNKPFEVCTVHNGELGSERWPRILPEMRHPIDTEMDISRINAIWSGDDEDDYAIAAITGTMAVILTVMGKANDQQSAHSIANQLWQQRDKTQPLSNK